MSKRRRYRNSRDVVFCDTAYTEAMAKGDLWATLSLVRDRIHYTLEDLLELDMDQEDSLDKVMFTSIDISMLRLAEQTLIQTLQRYQTVVEDIKDEVLSRENEETLGSTSLILSIPDDAEAMESFQEYLEWVKNQSTKIDSSLH